MQLVEGGNKVCRWLGVGSHGGEVKCIEYISSAVGFLSGLVLRLLEGR